MSPEQLTFDLPVRETRGRDDFFISPANETALAALDGWSDWPSGKLLLIGPEGSGKTHLAHVWAAQAEGRIVPADALTEAAVPGLASSGAVAVEDVDRNLVEPRALFHLHNLMAERGGALLLTARTPVRDWGLTLPDLESRMMAASAAVVAPPDDVLLQAVLLKQFADRQIAVTPDLIDWLLRRIERSFDAARSAVETLDAASLAAGKPVTRAFARGLLDKLGGDDA